MKHFMVLTHDEIQNNIPYALVCETMYGCRWNNGSRIRKFANEFTREEQKAISKMKKQSYELKLFQNFLSVDIGHICMGNVFFVILVIVKILVNLLLSQMLLCQN